MAATTKGGKGLDGYTSHNVGWICNRISKFEARDNDGDWSCQEIRKARTVVYFHQTP